MEKIKMTCTGCRNGCLMTVTVEDGEVVNVDGNGCMRGYARAQENVSFSEKEQPDRHATPKPNKNFTPKFCFISIMFFFK